MTGRRSRMVSPLFQGTPQVPSTFHQPGGHINAPTFQASGGQESRFKKNISSSSSVGMFSIVRVCHQPIAKNILAILVKRKWRHGQRAASSSTTCVGPWHCTARPISTTKRIHPLRPWCLPSSCMVFLMLPSSPSLSTATTLTIAHWIRLPHLDTLHRSA